MKIIANIVAISSLLFYCGGMFSKITGKTLIVFAIGDFVYELSYVLLNDFVTASSFILGIFVSACLGYLGIKNKKTPIFVYVLFELLEIASFIIFYTSPLEYLVLIANFVYVFFACLNNKVLFDYSVLVFAICLLVYNILIGFVLGIVIEAVMLITTLIEIILAYRSKKLQK
ncbi:MAG: YgjV family protein [Clostridia bacterium]|nr:YgjV family protein [Clostridia bacterium]